jgi:hypothetical protein
VEAIARGAAWFLMHPDTEATVFGVYGRWGLGKSTFMRLVEKEMLLEAARKEVADQEMQRRQAGPLHRYLWGPKATILVMQGRTAIPRDHDAYARKLVGILAEKMASTDSAGSPAGRHSLLLHGYLVNLATAVY